LGDDLKQLVWTITVSGDGAVPVHYNVYDGNVTDDQTHIETWDVLRQIVGSADFLYVADCKLCTKENLAHIRQQCSGSHYSRGSEASCPGIASRKPRGNAFRRRESHQTNAGWGRGEIGTAHSTWDSSKCPESRRSRSTIRQWDNP